MVVIGAGWIGSEVAASARQLGKEVALIEAGQVPLERVLGTEVGTIFSDLHADHEVELHMGVGVEAFRGSDAAEHVVLADGTIVSGDLFVVGVGVAPRTELAEAAGLAVDNGIVVDQHLATSRPGIWAAGDVANAYHPVLDTRIRLEHWSAALNQGPVAAKNMLGQQRRLREDPLLLLRPVRPRHGIQRLRRRSGTRSSTGVIRPAGRSSSSGSMRAFP